MGLKKISLFLFTLATVSCFAQEKNANQQTSFFNENASNQISYKKETLDKTSTSKTSFKPEIIQNKEGKEKKKKDNKPKKKKSK